MSTGDSPAIAHQARAPEGPSGGGPATLSPEMRRDLSRRLAGLAISYSGTYLLAFGTGWVRMLIDGQPRRSILPDVIALVSIAFGIMVFLAARRGKLPATDLANVTLAFQVVGALGIMGSLWGWEQQLDLFQRHVWEAVGSPAVAFPEGFVNRMLEAKLRILYLEGVPWAGVWLLIVPIFVPMSPRRTLLGVVLTAGTVPGLTLLSLVANGAPASVAPWVGELIADITVPTAICAALAFFASRTVYRLTLDLSRAQQLGSYRLVERIGAGGMGEVWRARHRLLARPAAIKLIRPEMLSTTGGSMGGPEMVRRFEREAQATAGLRSPHTVELYDFGVAPDGTFYYVMELLDGFDFSTLVDRFGPLSAPRTIHLLRQACHSLEDAHRAGLVHRDVKPSNIFTCRLGLDHDFVKVLDFGLVKSVAGAHETIELTAADVARGTPAFMAPEAVTGNSPVDARTDIYALGCVAYWLLTGRLVFEGPSALATLLKHVNEPPVPPSEVLGAPIPESLERLILGCLSKDPADRPATAAAFGDRLADCAASVGSWSAAEAEAWWREHAAAGGWNR